MKKRIIADTILLLALLFFPWWLFVPLAFFVAFSFNPFYEIIIIGLLADLIYGAKVLSYHGFLGVFFAAILFLAASYVRRVIR